MSTADLDWQRIHRNLWRAVQQSTDLLEADTDEFIARLLIYARENGTLTAEGEQALSDYLSAMDEQIALGVSTAVGGVAKETLAVPLRDPFIERAVADAYARRWPDGLDLSTRLWRWQQDTRQGVSARLAEGVRLGESVNNLVHRLQRTIERRTGENYAQVVTDLEDWATDLAQAGKRAIRNPKAYRAWLDTVETTRRHIDTLRNTGTRRQAKATFSAIRKAVVEGQSRAVDEALRWWVYDRQLADLKRVARTEMATAHHRAAIDATQEDEFVVGYRWRLSASHPEPDICDYYANIELGLGRGIWPKDRVPHDKAHPNCMCSLIPVTQANPQRGATGYDDLVALVPAATASKLVPKWAQAAGRLGVPLDRLMRTDGMGFMALKDAESRWGKDRWAAISALGTAAQVREWPRLKLRLTQAQWRDRRAALAKLDEPEVQAYLRRVERSGGKGIDSRQHHYIVRRYLDREPLGSPEDLDILYEATFKAPDAAVYKSTTRYTLYSSEQALVSIAEANGQRVTGFRANAAFTPNGEQLWTLSDLLNL